MRETAWCSCCILLSGDLLGASNASTLTGALPSVVISTNTQSASDSITKANAGSLALDTKVCFILTHISIDMSLVQARVLLCLCACVHARVFVYMLV